MPSIKLPPDKAHSQTLTASATTIDLVTETSQSSIKEIVINAKEFEKSLAKPLSLSTKSGAENLKKVIQGKYQIFQHKPITLSPVEPLSGPHSDSARQKRSKTIKTGKIDAKETYDRQSAPSSSEIYFASQVPQNLIPPIRSCALPPYPSSTPVAAPYGQPPDTTLHSLPNIIKKLLSSSSKLHQPLFRFEASPEAALHNWKLLSSNNFNLDKLLNPKKKTITSYDSEFKPTTELDPLFQHHPRWKDLKSRLDNGVSFQLTPLDETIRQQDLNASFERGNHKSAGENEEHLATATKKEIKKGWNIILPDKFYQDIPDLILNPMGVASQSGISAFGEFIDKLRITHDLSFPGKISEESVNSRLMPDGMEPCMFRHTLLRTIHHIVNLRSRYPSEKIWLRKEDLKSAYRRMHLSASSSFSSAVRVKLNKIWYILLSVRLPFGGASCPPEFCLLSDLITDLINDILSCDSWDHHKIASNYVKKIPPAVMLDPKVPFAQAKSMIVSLPNEDHGKADVFIDDIITVAVNINQNLQRAMAAPCTIIHAISHNETSDPIIPRDNLIADDKNDAEGAPEELKICLGWLLDTRRLKVSLPSHKSRAWSKQVQDTINQKTVSEKLLASVLGRLENIATIIPMMGHFLNKIRYLQMKADQLGHNV